MVNVPLDEAEKSDVRDAASVVVDNFDDEDKELVKERLTAIKASLDWSNGPVFDTYEQSGDPFAYISTGQGTMSADEIDSKLEDLGLL